MTKYLVKNFIVEAEQFDESIEQIQRFGLTQSTHSTNALRSNYFGRGIDELCEGDWIVEDELGRRLAIPNDDFRANFDALDINGNNTQHCTHCEPVDEGVSDFTTNYQDGLRSDDAAANICYTDAVPTLEVAAGANTSAFFTRFSIRYCPWCGRKLKEAHDE